MQPVVTIAKRILIIGGLAVLVLLVMDFNSRMAELTRLSAQHQRETQMVAEMVSTQNYLETQIAYATSEPAVEAWAREDGRWAQPGDYPIVPLPDENATPQQAQSPTATPQPLTYWQAWILWFFNRAP